MAMRRGAFADEIDAAEAMGKKIGQRREVAHWSEKLDALQQLEEAPAKACVGLLVQSEWIEKEAPGIQQLDVEALVLSPGERHAKHKVSALSATPHGSTRETSATIDYTLPPVEGERENCSGLSFAHRAWGVVCRGVAVCWLLLMLSRSNFG